MGENVHLGAAQSLAGIARELAEQPDLGATRQRVVDMGTKLMGCDATALLRVDSPTSRSLLATSDRALLEAENSVDGGTRQSLVVKLRWHDEDLGVLVFYAETAGYFSAALRELGEIYAEHASIALALAAASNQALNLRIAVSTNRVIGEAVGILMVRAGITAEAAFEVLRRRSQDQNVKLRVLAEQVVEWGDLPDLAA